MLTYLAWSGDLGRLVARASHADDAEGLRRIAQVVDGANAVWRSWVERTSGSVITVAGDEGRAEVPADRLGELQAVREQVSKALGVPVSVGVGMRVSEAERALLAARLRGGDQVAFWSEECDELVAEANKRGDSLGHADIASEYLDKAAPAMNPGAFGGVSGPSRPTVDKPMAAQGDHEEAQDVYDLIGSPPGAPEQTHAGSDFERQLHDEARKGGEEDASQDRGREQRAAEVKQHVAQALQVLKQQAPLMEQLRQQAPDAYQALVGLTQAVVAMARELSAGADMRKAEVALKPPPAEGRQEHLVHEDPRGHVVYRVQDREGRGPYAAFVTGADKNYRTSPGKTATEGLSHHGLVLPADRSRDEVLQGPTVQPGPRNDFDDHEWSRLEPEEQVNLHFGFESPDHARAWFGNEALQQMSSKGFRLAPVRAKKVWRSKSGRQVVFLPADDLGKGDVWDHFGKARKDASSLRAPQDRERELVHYGVVPGLREISVDKMGTGAPAAEYRQGAPEVGRAYYYRAGADPEPLVTQGARAVYRARLAPEQRLYDLGEDPENILGPARERFLAGEGLDSPDDTALDEVRRRGYHGFHNSRSAMPHVVALFHPHPVEEVKKEELEKVRLPMPGATARHHVVLPVGSVLDEKVKVQHSDGKTSWRQVKAGMIRSQDPSGHPTSSRSPNSK